jgi:photosystem II stability/assembly factor-like uncharacterized protein
MHVKHLMPLAAAVLALAGAACTPGTRAPSGPTTPVAPCAPAGQGTEGAGIQHPERAPLQAQASFVGDIGWAVCGADPVFGAELLNLRSDDGGRTWRATDTGIAFTPFHAGDVVDVELTNATTGRIHVVSRVGEVDRTYETVDGGHTWQPAR